MKRTRIAAAVLPLLLLAGGIATAQRPRRNVAPGRHPNLAEAQRLSQQAWDAIDAAQRANEWDLGGHAKKAKQLLDQVNNELKKAAEDTNHR